MEIRTLKTLLAIVAAVSLIGVLTLLIFESRAVKDEYYVAHAERMRAIESIETDFTEALQGTQGAFDEGRRVPLSIELALARLLENNALIRDLSDGPRRNPEVQARLDAFDEEIRRFVSRGQAFAETQNAFAAALQSFQKESPAVVKYLRDTGLPTLSQAAFILAIDIIDFATGQAASSPTRLSQRVAELRDDPRLGSAPPAAVVAFADAASSVIDQHIAAEVTLTGVRNDASTASLSALFRAILDDNRLTVGRAERARALLSVCAVILLIAVAFAVIRLQSTYRDLNRSNAELERANVTLEDRVSARTQQLSEAYDELKESQVQLIHAEKMSSLGEMVAGISHEINTPLWYLMNNSSVVQERLDAMSELCDVAESMLAAVRSRTAVRDSINSGLIDMHRLMKAGLKDDIDEAKSLIQDSIDGLDELTALAQSLKDFSRLDRAHRGQFNVNDGLDKTLRIVKNRIKNKVTVHKHYGDVPDIQCSPSQINQIFLNLLTNAADAISERGDVVLHTWAENGNVEISIADTGCGIPPELLPKVCDPFYTTKEVGKGTGLGLSIVDQIVTSHKGSFRIESEPGKGTIVTVVLPTGVSETVTAGATRDDATALDTEIEAAVLHRGGHEQQDGVTTALSA